MGRDENPLSKYWSVLDSREEQRKHWAIRRRGLFIGAASTSIVVTFFITSVTLDSLTYGGGLGGLLSRQAAWEASVAVLTLGVMLWAFCWLIGELCQAQHTAFSFLSSEYGRRPIPHFDDHVSMTPLGEREILFALLFGSWRRLVAPLVILATCSALVASGLTHFPSHLLANDGNSLPTITAPSSLVRLLAAAMTLVIVLLSGFIVSAVHVLLAIGLGAGDKSGLLAAIGARVGVLFQLLSGIGSLSVAYLYDDLPTDRSYHVAPSVALLSTLLATGILVLFLYMSHRIQVIRRVLGYGYPLLFIAFLAAWMSLLFGSPGSHANLPTLVSWIGTASSLYATYSYLTPLALSLMPSFPANSGDPSAWQFLVLPALVLLSQSTIAFLAWSFALVSLKRRRRGL